MHFAQGGHSVTLCNTLYDPPGRKPAGASDGRLVTPMNGRVVAVNALAGAAYVVG